MCACVCGGGRVSGEHTHSDIHIHLCKCMCVKDVLRRHTRCPSTEHGYAQQRNNDFNGLLPWYP